MRRSARLVEGALDAVAQLVEFLVVASLLLRASDLSGFLGPPRPTSTPAASLPGGTQRGEGCRGASASSVGGRTTGSSFPGFDNRQEDLSPGQRARKRDRLRSAFTLPAEAPLHSAAPLRAS